MKIDCNLDDFRVPAGTAANLADRPTKIDALTDSKSEYRERLGEFRDELADLQNVLYAHDRYALLLVFQGMDTAGKDGAIKHVMSGVNPQGCQVFSFKRPSDEELDHDYLWRTNKRLPERGRIGIFNRSYYEEVLVVRVHPAILQGQRMPAEFVDQDTIWEERFRDIVNVEDYLHRNGTRIIKFFLHVSKEEQRQRFLARIDEPSKNWKMSKDDITVRAEWEDYQHAYEECLSATSTDHAPWFVVPADRKRDARLVISHAVVEALKGLDMHYPEPSDNHRALLQEARLQLEAEEGR